MSKETFTRDKPHVNIAMIGGAVLVVALVILGASTLFRDQNALTESPTDTPAPAQTSAPTNTSQSSGSASGTLTVNQLWGDWFLYVDPCGGSFPVLQTRFTLRNDGPEPVLLTESTLMVTYFEVSQSSSPDDLPEHIQIFTLPNFPQNSSPDNPGPIPPGGELHVVLELTPTHPDFLWNPTHSPVPTATTSSGGGGGGNTYTFYGRYYATTASLTTEDTVGNTLWGDWFIVDPGTSRSVPAATLLLPYFAIEGSSGASAGNQLWGDYFYVDVAESAAAGINQLWGDYKYLDAGSSANAGPSGDGPTGFKDTSISVVLLPENAGLFKDTADGEPASASNIVLKRGITRNDAAASDDSGEFWFFDAGNWEVINDAIEDDHIGAYHFLLEVGDEDVPVIIAQLPNAQEEDKRPPMTLVVWSSKFPQQANQTNLSFIKQLGQRAGYATVSGAPEDIQLMEIADPSRCLTPTVESGTSFTDTPQPGQPNFTPTDTLQPSRTPQPGNNKPTPTDTLQPSRTPRPSKPSPTPTKDENG